MIIGNGDRNLGLILVEFHLGDIGGGEGGFEELVLVFAVLDDVDFFTVEFVDDSLNTNAFLANAGTDGVDPFLVTGNSDFGSIAGFAGNAFGDNTTGANFRDFAGKEGGNKTGIGTANDDLRR